LQRAEPHEPVDLATLRALLAAKQRAASEGALPVARAGVAGLLLLLLAWRAARIWRLARSP
jgi:hypothetical protein